MSLDALVQAVQAVATQPIPGIRQGTVTSLTPLAVQLDGDPAPLTEQPWMLGPPLSVVGQRVLSIWWEGHRAIIGASTGPAPGTVVGSYYMSTARVVTTTTETPIMRMSFSALGGRQYLISTGNIPYYVAGGPSTYVWYRLRYSTTGAATATSTLLTTPLVPVGGNAGNGNIPAGPIAALTTFFPLGTPGGTVSVALTCAQGSAASGICRTYPVEMYVTDAGPSTPRTGESL